MILLLLFIVVPIAELVVIGQMSGALGLGWTLLLLFADSVAGAFLVRHEGRRAWRAFWEALQEARWPGDEVANGMLVLVGGALLLTPGFLTDGAGLALVLPPTRRAVAAIVKRRFVAGSLTVVGGPVGPMAGWAGGRVADNVRGRRGGVFDVEVVSIERDDLSGRPPEGDEPTPPPLP